MKAAYWVTLLSPFFIATTCAPIPVTRAPIDRQGRKVQSLQVQVGQTEISFDAKVYSSLYPGNNGYHSLLIRLKDGTGQAVDWSKSSIQLSSFYHVDFDSLNKELASNMRNSNNFSEAISASGPFRKLSKNVVRNLRTDTVFMQMHLEAVTGLVLDTTIKFYYFK